MAIERVQVLDYAALGRKIVEWATTPNLRPRNVHQLKQQLDGVAIFPDRIKHVQFVESTLDTFVFRLPPADMAMESLEWIRDQPDTAEYRLPGFYSASISHEEMLFSRIGDYSVSQCA